MARYYRRHLPHGAPENAAVFVTWNLKGALPKTALQQIEAVRKDFSSRFEPLCGNDPKIADGMALAGKRHALQVEMAKRLFRVSESFLDQAHSGPLDLKEPRQAEIVRHALLESAGRFFDLYAFVVMANHVHALIRPKVELTRITGGIKSITARRINAVRQRQGTSLWQDETFDHRPRNVVKFMQAIAYIENNPVKAGLCRRPEDWHWSSASMRDSWPIGTAFAKTEERETGD
jgi:REP element-mobilizing transposase RayT